MSKYIYLFTFAVVLLSVGCTPRLNVAATLEDLRSMDARWAIDSLPVPLPIELSFQDSAVRTVLFMERTPCAAYCAVYRLEIWSDGNCWYEGNDRAPLVGKHHFRLTRAQMQALQAEALRVGYFAFAPKYPTHGAEMLTFQATITHIEADTLQHTVFNRHHSPAALQRLERWIDEQLVTWQ